ncbi:cytochrome c biogenesis protein CcdA [soil metagenome]
MGDLTLAAAFVAGVLSFLSPCVLPVVPAYLGQLGALTVAGTAAALPLDAAVSRASAQRGSPALATAGYGRSAHGTVATRSGFRLRRRWQVLPHALAFVLGFGTIFTVLGVTATYAGGELGRSLPFLRQLGGVVLIILGLNMAGVLPFSALARSWRPLDRLAARRRSPIASRTPLGAFGLGSIFALGWTPCIGPTLGAIFGLSALGATPQLGALFAAYSLGLGVPFIGLALALDRAPALTRPLVRHGRLIEVVGGGLVVVIGLAILFDWLTVLFQLSARFFPSPV